MGFVEGICLVATPALIRDFSPQVGRATAMGFWTAYLQGSNQAYQCIENIKLDRATVAGIKSSPKAGFYGRMKFDPSTFDFNALSRAGK